MILGKNKSRTGLVINNYGTQNIYLYDSAKTVLATNGFTLFPGFGLAFLSGETCPQSEIFAGQAAAGGILNIMEIAHEEG